MMDLTKKRVSFAQIIVPKHLISSSPSSPEDYDDGSDYDDDEDDEQSDNKSNNQSNNQTTAKTCSRPLPTFKTLETIKIPLNNNNNIFTEISLNSTPSSPTATETTSNALKFLQTRRRSQAFSVSAIDETLSVNMDGEDYYNNINNNKDCFDEESHHIGIDDIQHRTKIPTTTTTLQHYSSNSTGTFADSRGKYFRAAEIPTGSNRILIFQTKNEVIDRKSFQHEVRAIKDVDWFLARPNVLIDCDGNSVEMIIDQMLEV